LRPLRRYIGDESEDGGVSSQQERGEEFARLHEGPATFLVPNPWDVGTARLLAHLGFEAPATTGAGYAFATGRPDGTARSEEQLAYAASMASACDLPVTADLEDGFGDDSETVHATILEAGRLGLVGASIEDRSYGRASAGLAGRPTTSSWRPSGSRRRERRTVREKVAVDEAGDARRMESAS
jgi:2-methylisocitrate lyase-like PEP mutase family enzyme